MPEEEALSLSTPRDCEEKGRRWWEKGRWSLVLSSSSAEMEEPLKLSEDKRGLAKFLEVSILRVRGRQSRSEGCGADQGQRARLGQYPCAWSPQTSLC